MPVRHANFSVQLDPETREALNDLAREQDRSAAAVARQAIRRAAAEATLLKNGKRRSEVKPRVPTRSQKGESRPVSRRPPQTFEGLNDRENCSDRSYSSTT